MLDASGKFTMKPIFSGEPLPIPPRRPNDPELEAFHRKVIDYLRRLTGKLNPFVDPPDPPDGSPGTVQTFVAILEGDTADSVPVLPFPLEWTRCIHNDGGTYSHSGGTNPEEIKILQDGVYVVQVDVKHAYKDTPLDYQLQVKVGSDWYDVGYGFSQGHQVNFILGAFDTFHVSLPLIEDSIIRIMISPQAPTVNAGHIEQVGTRITILRVSAETNGGSGGEGIGWDDYPVPSWLEEL
jgi:hypothetical protein